jgi:hypothetical protein
MKRSQYVYSIAFVGFLVAAAGYFYNEQRKEEKKLAAAPVKPSVQVVPDGQRAQWRRVEGNADLYYLYDKRFNAVCYTKNPFNPSSTLSCL